MVKLFAVELFYKAADKVNALKAAHDLQSFSYFQRSTVKEFMVFTGSVIVDRTSRGSRASVKEQDYMCHVYVHQNGLGGVAVCDKDYPQRVAFNMLNKLIEDFTAEVSAASYSACDPSTYTFDKCQTFLEKYQNPNEADPMMKVQTELDETKVIVYDTIEKVLQRGEKLDDLVAKSEHLGTTSKAFAKTAKKTNACCSYV